MSQDGRDTLLVTGSREWEDWDTIDRWLSMVAPRPGRAGLTRLVHGAARGADEIAGAIGRQLGFEVVPYPVDVELDGPWPAAGVRRNERMVKLERGRVRRALAFSWIVEGKKDITTGTSDCVWRLVHAGIPVTVVTPGARP